MLGLSKERRKAYGEAVFLLYFVLMISARAVGLYEGTTVYTVVLLFAMILFGIKVLITGHSLREYIIMIACLGITGIVYLNTGEKGLIICFMTVFGMKCVDRRKVILYGAISAALCITFRVFTGVFGILPEKYYPQMRDGIGLMFRHSLGYVHPNTLHMNVLMLSMMIIYLCSSGLNEVKQIKKRDRVIRLVALDILVFAYNVYVFFYSGSRTGLLAAAVYVFVSFWFFMRPVPGIVEKAACYAAYPVVCFISVVLPFILPDGIFEKIDRTVFNTRLTIARYFMSNNRISLFGIRLNNPLPEYRTYGLDMSHMYLFLQLGLVAFVMIGMFTMGFVHLALRKGMMAELAVLLGTLFAGIWEPYLYNLGFKNFTYVFMGTLLYELTSESEDHLYAKSDSDSWIFGFRIGEALCLRRLLITAAVGMLAGCIAASVYLAATDVPSALYADLSEDESGVGFGMEELYLSPEEISQLRSDGNLVVGYADGKTPMYKYDSGIAVSEYHKRALSVGVWTGLAFAAAVAFVGTALDKNRGTGRDE